MKGNQLILNILYKGLIYIYIIGGGVWFCCCLLLMVLFVFYLFFQFREEEADFIAVYSFLVTGKREGGVHLFSLVTVGMT